MTGKPLPLSRFKVLDLTVVRAGPSAVRVLADWGADVIRIEPPPGSGGVSMGGPRDGPDFQNLHRNKRAITLDLKSPEGHAIFMKLAAQADVIVENMRVAVKKRLGIDYESVKKVNPRIVYGSISGFGQTGPISERPCVDQVAQGMGGLMSVTGLPGQGPVRAGIAICDVTAGALLVQAILIALLDRERTGEGAWVHTSLLEAIIGMADFQAARWLMKGEVAGQEGNNHPTNVPTSVYPTRDGHINLAATGKVMFDRLCRALGAEDWLSDPRFASDETRRANREALNALIAERTAAKTSDEWDAIFAEIGIPCGPIYSFDQTFAHPQVKHLGMAQPVAHPRLGEINLVAQPINISGYGKDQLRWTVPDMGANTAEVLASLGYDEAAIASLREKRVI